LPPQVKVADEWGDPTVCEAGDNCQYCHTRTEQQFHPEIYKSTKCNDIQNTGYCPRGAFCAFAHVERESQSQPGLKGGQRAAIVIDMLNYSRNKGHISLSTPGSRKNALPCEGKRS